jgi:hypothetical protein
MCTVPVQSSIARCPTCNEFYAAAAIPRAVLLVIVLISLRTPHEQILDEFDRRFIKVMPIKSQINQVISLRPHGASHVQYVELVCKSGIVSVLRA